MKDNSDEYEKLEKQKKKTDSKTLSSKDKGKEKEEKDSSKKIFKKENNFATKGDIKRALILKQSFYLLLSRETSLSTAIPHELEGLINQNHHHRHEDHHLCVSCKDEFKRRSVSERYIPICGGLISLAAD